MAYIINLDKYKSIGTHWIALYVNGDNVTYFVSLGVEHIPKEIKKFIGNENFTASFDRIQTNYSRLCGWFFIGFIEFELKGLLDYTNLFSRSKYGKNDKITVKYFQ